MMLWAASLRACCLLLDRAAMAHSACNSLQFSSRAHEAPKHVWCWPPTNQGLTSCLCTMQAQAITPRMQHSSGLQHPACSLVHAGLSLR